LSMKSGQQALRTSFKLSHAQYRERIHIIRDILLKLIEYGELNQTALMSFCGLNLTKHRSIVEEMEAHGIIRREVQTTGKTRLVSIFKATPEGLAFFKAILEPYEKMFPQKLATP
jgi:predicted transcriptional regulator